MEDRAYKKIAETDTHWWYQGRKVIIERIMRQYLSSPLKILEVGCGPGGNLSMLKQFGSVVGMESYPYALEWAKKHNPEIPLLTHNIPCELSETFDVICLFDVLEHIEDEEMAIKWIFDHLNENGWLFLTVPAFPFLWGQTDIESHHFRRYTKMTLLKCVENHFIPLKIGYFNFFLFPAVVAVRLWKRFAGEGKDDWDYGRGSAILDKLLYSLFAFEKNLLPYVAFPFGSSLIGVLRKKKNG